MSHCNEHVFRASGLVSCASRSVPVQKKFLHDCTIGEVGAGALDYYWSPCNTKKE